MPRQTYDGTTYERNTPPIEWGTPKFKLNDCKCGGSQRNKEIYTLYVGAGSFGSWYVRCKKCGTVIADANEEVVVQKWNGDNNNG
jgi:hypothetical protein